LKWLIDSTQPKAHTIGKDSRKSNIALGLCHLAHKTVLGDQSKARFMTITGSYYQLHARAAKLHHTKAQKDLLL